jgi:hypothetical protein
LVFKRALAVVRIRMGARGSKSSGRRFAIGVSSGSYVPRPPPRDLKDFMYTQGKPFVFSEQGLVRARCS